MPMASPKTPAPRNRRLFYLLQQLREQFPDAMICGHRDFSPDLNGNGIIEPWEWMKACPCFDAIDEYQNL